VNDLFHLGNIALAVQASLWGEREARALETRCEQPDKISVNEAVAIKKGQMRERAPAFEEMGTLRCDGCGEEFVIFHDPAFVDKKAAAGHAHWLEKVFC
jgi:hypothetical protein